MDKRWYKWLRYSDAQYFIFRENVDGMIYCARFSRSGFTVDFWNININILRGKGKKDLILLRDTLEENGPSVNKNTATYLYVAPRTLVYQEINFIGRSVKVKEYTTDYDLGMIDAVVYNRRVYMIKDTAMIIMTVNDDKMTKDQETRIPPNKVSMLGFTVG